ncbi:MAG: transposase [Candidatus Binataceae bacterium]
MALGKRKREVQGLFVATSDLPQSPGHPFYKKLNELLRAAGFDDEVEKLCAPHYADRRGRPGIPPGVYFRMLFVGYFEGLDSQRAIAWRCSDSLGLRDFLGLGPTERSPDHSSLTVIRQRLPQAVHEQVFAKVIAMAEVKGLLAGKTLGVDSTLIEANAAMKAIVRRDNGDDWKTYLRKQANEAGIENPTDDELRRFDQKRQGKKVSNQEWVSSTDSDSRIAKMKDGRTHLAYKVEHAVDLETNLVVAATVHAADQGDAQTLVETVVTAQVNLVQAGSEAEVKEVVADKGYSKAETLAACAHVGVRTYVPEPERPNRRRWTDKAVELKEAVVGTRRRTRGARGQRLGRKRSEYVERTFAHVCETGGARRSWLRGLEKIRKRYLMTIAAHNLGVMMRALFGIGTPRGLQTAAAALVCAIWALWEALNDVFNEALRNLWRIPPIQMSATRRLTRLPSRTLTT